MTDAEVQVNNMFKAYVEALFEVRSSNWECARYVVSCYLRNLSDMSNEHILGTTSICI